MMNKRESQAGLTMLEVMIASVILFAVVAMASYMVWTSSRTVSEAELGIQMESQARSVIAQIANDVRQCKALYIRDYSSGSAVLPAANTGFSAIQLRLPGTGFDSTTLNAATTAAAKQTWHDAYVANNDAYLTRMVRYVWAVDAGEGETAVDALDNNSDGRVDEGVIKKFEAVTDAAGNPDPANSFNSTICRDLRNCNVSISAPILSPYTPATTPATQLSPCNWGLQFVVDAWPGPTKLTITLTLEKIDPQKHQNTQNHTIVKQVQTVVDLRN